MWDWIRRLHLCDWPVRQTIANMQWWGISSQSLVEQNNLGSPRSVRTVLALAWWVWLIDIEAFEGFVNSMSTEEWWVAMSASEKQISQITWMVRRWLNLLSNLAWNFQITMSGEERFFDYPTIQRARYLSWSYCLISWYCWWWPEREHSALKPIMQEQDNLWKAWLLSREIKAHNQYSMIWQMRSYQFVIDDDGLVGRVTL